MAVLFLHPVFKTVYLLKNDPSVLHMSQDMAAAGGSDIHCKIIFSH